MRSKRWFIIIPVVLGLFLIIAIYEEYDGRTIRNFYEICKDEETGETIYVSHRCGEDTCWSTFYDSEKNVIEKTPEYGNSYEYEIQTKVTNCKKKFFPVKW